jgi:hypothetical protein
VRISFKASVGLPIAALAWSFGLLAVFAPLAVRRYRKTD